MAMGVENIHGKFDKTTKLAILKLNSERSSIQRERLRAKCIYYYLFCYLCLIYKVLTSKFSEL